MNRFGWAGVMLAAASFMLSSVPARAQEYHARLSGFQEVGGLGAGETGAILSTGEGTLKLTVDKAAQTISYTLTYSFPDLPPGTEVLQSHIHFGKVHVAGNIILFFCTNKPVPPPAAPALVPLACPTPSGTVSRTLTAADVLGVASQNVPAGAFAALVSALASDTAYVNIHTTTFPSGEIRGQILRADRDHRGPRRGGDDHEGAKDDDHHH